MIEVIYQYTNVATAKPNGFNNLVTLQFGIFNYYSYIVPVITN